MRLVKGTPNPAGNIDQLFLLQGGGISTRVDRIDGFEQLPVQSGNGHLRIFHFNDLHNHLTDLSGQTKGTRRFAQMVQQVRAANGPKLFLSIGDDHTGTMLDELVGWNQDAFTLDPSYRAYSGGGIDATVLGNHEFDRGSPLLARGIRSDARFPVLSANVHGSCHLMPGQDYSPGAIAIVGGVRIGLLGLTTHIETRVGQASDPTLAVASPIEVLNNILPALMPLVDVVLILSHCGYGDGAHKSGKAAAVRDIGEADFSLARTAAAITDRPVLILGAHTHTRLNENGLDKANILNGVPIFQAECNGQYLGEIKLALDPALKGGWAVEKACLHRVKPRNVMVGPSHQDAAQFEQDTDVDLAFESDVIAPILTKVEDALKVKVADVQTHVLTFETAVLERYSSESALVNFICDTIVNRMKTLGHDVDFALMNGATIQAGIEPGSLSAGNWFNVMPYADEIFITRVTGAQLTEMLQSNAKRLLRRDEFADTDHTGFLARGFLHTSREIRYRINPGATAAEAQALEITFDGQPLKDQNFNVIMSTYLALGGFGERWNGAPISGGVPGDLAGHDLRGLPSRNTALVFRDEVGAQMRVMQTLTDSNVAPRDGRLHISGKNP